VDLLVCASKPITFYLVKINIVDEIINKSYDLNCNGLVCPLPVARTKRKLNEMDAVDILEVTGDFSESGENIKRYIEKHGDKVLEFKIEGENYYIKIEKA